MNSTMVATASAAGTPLRWDPSRKRKDTDPESRSSPPAMRTKGAFSFEALRFPTDEQRDGGVAGVSVRFGRRLLIRGARHQQAMNRL